jgi:N,N'-diacetyllegionaminate synthase
MDRVFIIAEAGVNHNGDINIAKQLIDIAVEAEADAVKFQTFIASEGIAKKTPKVDYQIQNDGEESSMLEMCQKLELSEDNHRVLIEYSKKRNIKFMSTAMGRQSVDLLNKFELDVWKISSGEIVNLPLLRKIGKLNKKIILSTGMANLGEVETALEILTSSGTKRSNISILHCTTEYPTPMCDVNLKAMLTLERAFQLPVGYSDHTVGIEVAVAAVALGAKIIEKHFTVSRKESGPDHLASLEPLELKEMVNSIRNIELALGSGVKKISESEKKNISLVRRAIVAETHISQGDKFTENNLGIKKAGEGISPMRWDEIIGREAVKDFAPDEMIYI